MAALNPTVPRLPWRLWLRCWLGCWLLFVCIAHGNLESTDTTVTMQGARALWLRGDSGLLRSGDGAQWLAEGLLADHIVAKAPNGMGKTGRDGRHQYVWFPIGHLGVLVPFVAIGGWLERAFPGVEQRYRELARDPGLPPYALAFMDAEGQFVLEQGAIAVLLPPAVGATTILLLWLIARTLGCSDRQALLVALATMFGTQCLATARETISNGCGMVFLLGAVLAMLRCHAGAATARTLWLGGTAAGAAVLCRYQQAVLLLPIAVVIALACRRQRRPRQLLAFALGGAPFLLLWLVVNQARFGSPFVTGYPPLPTYAPWLGVPRMLFAASKGILWLSPLLWLAVPLALRRAQVPVLRWFVGVVFGGSVAMFASMGGGWQSGQCWGSRYVTDAIVVLVAFTLAQARPWQRWPRTFRALLAAGVFVNLTGVVAPVRGHAQLATQATLAWHEQALARGEIGEGDLAAVRVDPPDRFYQEWRYSVLLANWRYAWQSLRGGFERADGHAANGAAATIGAVFGVTSDVPEYIVGPVHWEDRAFRHLAWKFWGDLLGVPWWALLLPPLAAGSALLWAGWRRLSKD